MPLILDQLIELVLAALDLFLAVGQSVVALLDFAHARVELLRLLVEAFFLLLKAPLRVFHLVAALLCLLVELRPHLQQFFFRFELGFLDACTGRLRRVFDDAAGLTARFRKLGFRPLPVDHRPQQREDDRASQADSNSCDD